MKPLVDKVKSTKSVLPKISASNSRRSGDIPEAYILPTIEPADVPVTILTGILFSFKTLIIPIWAKPLDAPPPKASATVAFGLGAGCETVF